MIKRLTRAGNSVALVLDRGLLRAARLDAGSSVEVSTDGELIVISPLRRKQRVAKLKAIVAELDHEYAGVFKRLAE